MDKILNILRSGILWVGTVNDTKPAVRPFGAAIEFNEKIYLFTANDKDVYKQIVSNPNIEIGVMLDDDHWARIRARAFPEGDDKIVDAFLKDDPELEAEYAVGDGKATPIRLEDIEVILA